MLVDVLKRVIHLDAFRASLSLSRYILWSCQNVCDALSYFINVMRQSACLVFNPIMVVDNYAAFFNCTPVGRASGFMPRVKVIHLSWLGPKLLVCCLAHRVQLVFFFCSGFSVSKWAPRDHHRESSVLIHNGGYHDLFVCP